MGFTRSKKPLKYCESFPFISLKTEVYYRSNKWCKYVGRRVKRFRAANFLDTRAANSIRSLIFKAADVPIGSSRSASSLVYRGYARLQPHFQRDHLLDHYFRRFLEEFLEDWFLQFVWGKSYYTFVCTPNITSVCGVIWDIGKSPSIGDCCCV